MLNVSAYSWWGGGEAGRSNVFSWTTGDGNVVLISNWVLMFSFEVYRRHDDSAVVQSSDDSERLNESRHLPQPTSVYLSLSNPILSAPLKQWRSADVPPNSGFGTSKIQVSSSLCASSAVNCHHDSTKMLTILAENLTRVNNQIHQSIRLALNTSEVRTQRSILTAAYLNDSNR